MNRLAVIVEGSTEQTFVRNQLAPHLMQTGVHAWPVLSGRRGNLQGVRKWTGALEDIKRHLKSGVYVTTMFDYYGLPTDWPGREDARGLNWDSRASHVQEQVRQAVLSSMSDRFNPERFVPYVQLHEFEALAFSDIDKLAAVAEPLSLYSLKTLQAHFAEIVEACGCPEAINDGYETCPSRRIVAKAKAYNKAAHGPIIADRIGIKKLREKCLHFNNWIDTLESLGGST